ncbi:alpha/beta hydrolase [Tenggerimyces flavus]|uniref:Alpha/beta hydrolase fold domain-containing protein n=1 Tax=Tenggerimyces flavus TaxID=1708749 RepID=A0ABV7YQE8_9ACTN|nr:alpha/beta hydrolase [Tenggerimyces flavus]MBM7790259.1 acetyl esterase/lipase [Tenggerimyces flavus]
MVRMITEDRSEGGAIRRRRGPLFAVAGCAGIGGVIVILVGLPAMWQLTWPYTLALTLLLAAGLAAYVAAGIRPTRARMLLAAVPTAGFAGVWLLTQAWPVLPDPNPWTPLNATVGITGHLCFGLEALALLGLLGVAARPGRISRPRWRRVVAMVVAAPVLVLVVAVTTLGVVLGSNAFAGAAIPAATVAPHALPAGQRSTVEYCRPDGIPLPMDLYLPAVAQRRSGPAPVVMYAHGGGFVLGNRRLDGLGARLGGHEGALFVPLQKWLNALGFVVASIDYRLAPGVPPMVPVEDAKCAVRFLRAHAAGLGIDPHHIGVWGSSAGGTISSLVGLAGPGAGFDHGQYADQSSAVQAVVDMFGPADLTRVGDAGPFARFTARVSLGGSPGIRHAISPISYVRPDAPPFLILHGRDDTDFPVRQSTDFADRLRSAGVHTALVVVDGADHGLAVPGEQPSQEQLTEQVVDFLARELAGRSTRSASS